MALDKYKSVESYLFASDKERILELVMKMGSMAALALSCSIDALCRADESLAQAVVDGDDEIDLIEREIDLECLRSIAMRQPVRAELRLIFATIKTITDLERIGDESVNIAKWVIKLKGYPKVAVNPILIEMKDVAEGMLLDALLAFKACDGDMSADICLRDNRLDSIYSDVLSEFIETMSSIGKNRISDIPALAGQMWITRHLERIGDHVTNIAERVYFMDKGEALTNA
jgi:phosphate transport system protein